jgi:hypothetical protein
VRIEAGTVVTLTYDLRDCDGELLEQPEASLAYLHGGFDGIFPKVEAALAGREPGFELALTLDPDDAFGEYDAELLRVEPRDRFPRRSRSACSSRACPAATRTRRSSIPSPTSRRTPWWSTATIPTRASASGSAARCGKCGARGSEEISLGHALVDVGLSTQ